ncbi:MAG: efflux RND transporter periplasmic adaptor subunit [Lewinellaceae bacterium]|nr:efflux RND transporter periplasmic adaptor subunit [Lewinellaceae bacterium]
MTIHIKPIALLAFLTLTLAACGSEDNESQKTGSSAQASARTVETADVKPVQYRETVFATGKLALREEARLSFKTGGIIKRIYVDEGQSVRQGQVLAELALDEISAQTQQARLGEQQAEINVENAKLALRLAERDYENARGLYQDSVATLEQLQNAEVQLDNARNQLKAAQKGLAMQGEQVEVASFNLRYSKITAPSNGTILKKLAEANELTGPGTPVLLFGSKDKSKVIKVSLTDKDIIHVSVGDEAEVQFDAYPGHVFKGEVREVASMADPYTNTYEVEVEVIPEGKTLLSGFIGSVSIFTSSTSSLLEIPVDALIGADAGRGEVFVVEGNKAVKTQVSIFKMEGEHLLIQRGLDSTDKVVISGVGYLENEQPIMISQR